MAGKWARRPRFEAGTLDLAAARWFFRPDPADHWRARASSRSGTVQLELRTGRGTVQRSP
jgi:hypothetical protein